MKIKEIKIFEILLFKNYCYCYKVILNVMKRLRFYNPNSTNVTFIGCYKKCNTGVTLLQYTP